jgi:AraC-like DNA-binding protein
MAKQVDTLMTIAPPADLRHAVLTFVHRRDRHGGSVVVELPETRVSIQVFLADQYWLRPAHDPKGWRRVPRIGLWGPRLNWGYGFVGADVDVFAIGLTTQAVKALTGQPSGTFIDRVEPLAKLNAGLSRALEDIVARHTTFEVRANAAAAALRATVPHPKPPHQSDPLSALIETEKLSIGDAARCLRLSERQYRRVFQAHYGVAPKLYQRALRLDRALRSLHPRPWEPHRDEEEIDYADQSHMIKEFQALTGLTPSSYVRNKRRHGDQLLRTVAVDGIAPPPRK